MEVQKSQIHVNEPVELLSPCTAFHNPGRDLVKHVLGQTGNIVEKLVQAPVGEDQETRNSVSAVTVALRG